MKGVRGRVVLLTGAAGGIGAAIARRLAADGARLALADIDGPGLERLAAELKADTSRHEVDLTDRSALGSLVEAVVEAHGALDVLVCNAGLTVHGRFADHTEADIDRVLGVDLTSVLHLTRLALPHLQRADGAHIVLISSMAGFQAFPFQTVYSAAKFGLRGFGDALRIELAPVGIGVTTVMPGAIATPFLANAVSHDDATSGPMAQAMTRWGTPPRRVAAAVTHGIRWNRSRLRVGWDSHLVALLSWVAPPLMPLVLSWAHRARMRSG